MGFWDDITGQTGADAARQAAADQYAKEQAAVAGQRQAGTQAQQGYTDIAQQYNPFIAGGQGAYQQYLTALGLGGGDPSAITAAYRSQPGYASGFETGTKAALRGAAASGHGLDSGRTMKALYRFGSDYENTHFGDYLNRLMGVGNLGYGATGAKVGTEGTGVGANLGAQTSAYGGALKSAGTTGQGNIAAANSLTQGSQGLLKAGVSLASSAMGGGFGIPGGGSLGGLIGNQASPAFRVTQQYAPTWVPAPRYG